MGRALLASVAATLLCVQSLPAFAQYTVDTWLDYDGTSLQRYSETSGGVYDEQCHWEPWDGADFPIDLWVCSGQETIEVRVDTWLYAPGGAPVLALSDVDPDFASVGYLYGPGTNYGTWTAVAEHHARERWYQETCFPPGFTPPPPLQQCQGFVFVWDEYLGATMDEVDVPPPPPPCESISVIDGVAFSEMFGWVPQPEPFERGARIFCNSGQVAVDSRYSSFPPPIGPWQANPTYDPCRVFLNPVDALAVVHSHPFFSSPADYNAGNGCNGQPDPTISQVQLNALNFLVNVQFSQADKDWVSHHGIPLYMRNPLFGHTPMGEILRLDPGQENPVLVWPQ